MKKNDKKRLVLVGIRRKGERGFKYRQDVSINEDLIPRAKDCLPVNQFGFPKNTNYISDLELSQ